MRGLQKQYAWRAHVYKVINGHQHLLKLDGVGPVVNRPSTDKLHHFARKKEKKMTRDT